MIHKDSNFITVGIPTYNSSKYLKSCLMSVLSLKKVNQIIISDDCSQIDEIEYIEKLLFIGEVRFTKLGIIPHSSAQLPQNILPQTLQ